MKTQNNKLDFTKNAIIELNDQQMFDVDSAGATISLHVSRDKETQLEIDFTIYW